MVFKCQSNKIREYAPLHLNNATIIYSDQELHLGHLLKVDEQVCVDVAHIPYKFTKSVNILMLDLGSMP